MLRKVLPLLSAGAVVALTIAGVSLASRSAPSAAHGKADSGEQRYLDVTTASAFVDVDKSGGPSAGDEFVFNDQLKSPDGSQTLGTVQGSCVLTDLSEHPSLSRCSSTATFGDATINADGLSPAEGPFKFAITGGTGRYDQAHGEVTIQSQTDSRSTVTIDID